MLFDNFLGDKEDRFYFMFAFAVRAWLSLLFFVFVPFLLIHFGYVISNQQALRLIATYLLIGLIDFADILAKALVENRKIRNEKLLAYGKKLYF